MKLKEITNEIETKQKRLKEINQYIIREDALDIIRNNTNEIIRYQLKAGHLLEKERSPLLTEQELEPYVTLFNKIADRTVKLLKENWIEDDFDRFLMETKIDINDPNEVEIYEIAYNFFIDSYEDEQRGKLPFDINRMNTNLFNRNLAKPIDYRYREYIKEQEHLKNELDVLNISRKDTEEAITNYANPRFVWGGLFVIIYIAIVGIIYPTTLLPYPKNTFNDSSTKWLLILLFISELIVLFGYLAYAMKRLTKIKDIN